MFQLKPGLKCPVNVKGPNSPVLTMDYLFFPELSSTIVNSNRFPFSEAVPFYLKSQTKWNKPSNERFALHKTNKLLNKYYDSYGYPVQHFKKKTMQAMMIQGIRDIILGYREKNELTGLQDYWLYKINDYLISKIVSDQSLQFPRLKEFIRKKQFGSQKRLQNYRKMGDGWKKNADRKNHDVIKWLKNQYRPSLNFIKRTLKKNKLFLQMNMGNDRYRKQRLSNFRKSAALLNLSYDILGADFDKAFMRNLERTQKVVDGGDLPKNEKIISFVVKKYSRFNENQALLSICKDHFKSYYCHKRQTEKPSVGVQSSQEMAHGRVYSECVRKTLQLFNNKKHIYQPLRKTSRLEMLPFSKIEYDDRVKNFASKNLVISHLTFLEDLQNVFGAFAEELTMRKSIEDILSKDRQFDDPSEIPKMKSGNDEKSSIIESDVEQNDLPFKCSGKQKLNEGQWKPRLIKKASYIILRFLKNMTKMKFLSTNDVSSEFETQSEKSLLIAPPSKKLQLTPLLALKSLLSEKHPEKKLLHSTLGHLRNNAKALYKKIESKNKSLILDKIKDYHKQYTQGSGITSNEKDIAELLRSWDSEGTSDNALRQEDLFSSDSEKSVAYSMARDMFEYTGINTANKHSDHVRILCLLLLFLSMSDKIVSVRKAANKFFKSQKEKIKTSKGKEIKKKRKIISLPNFRSFLTKTHSPLEVKEYIAVAQRYCPDYKFYEKKSDLNKEVAPEVVKSEDEIVVPKPEVGAPPRDEKHLTELKDSKSQSEYKSDEGPNQPPRSEVFEIVEDQSYMSWKGAPCSKGFADKLRLYKVKHSTEWATYRDVTDFGIDKEFKSTDFFEFPNAMNIPKLVTEYNKEFYSPKESDQYLLDPTPISLKWDTNLWTKDERKITNFEKHDKDFLRMARIFTTFWITQDKNVLSWEEIQKLIFATWCGDNHIFYDESSKYFNTLSEVIDEFDKTHRKTRRIYDVNESNRFHQTEKKWYKVNNYLENATTIGALGVYNWRKELLNLYKDVESVVSTTSFSSLGGSVMGSKRCSSSNMDINLSRGEEKCENPTGFPLRDQKSLLEALTDFVERTKNYRGLRVSLFGLNYKPITDHYLKRLNEECGFVYCHGKPQDHPNARYAPPKAIFYSNKEKQFYHHSNNFIDAFQKKYPERFLRMPYHVKNEYGSMKHICTFISVRRLSWEKMDTWKGCMRFVCNKLECTPLEDPYRPPREMKSPYTTLAGRKGNPFELSLLLTGFLIAAGYDAYCVCGTVTYHRAHYRNTDDVSPDRADLQPPSTNRYKQYNMLPPFSSEWLRNTSAYKNPIPCEELKIRKFKLQQKEQIRKEREKWPTTENELIAEYNKEQKTKVHHQSRFDNPSIPLHTSCKAKETKGQVKTGDKQVLGLGYLYEELVQELLRRSAEEKVDERIQGTKTYIHEAIVPIKSIFETVRTQKKREERANRRQKEKLKTKTMSEENEYFNWLYGPNGTHKDFYEIFTKEKQRLEKKNACAKVKFLDFLDIYDPTKDRLETLTGQQLYFFKKNSFKCYKKVKKMAEEVRSRDLQGVAKLKVKRYQERMIRLNKVLKDKNIYGFPAQEYFLPIHKGKRTSLERKAHKYKLRQSPFIAKMLSRIYETFPNSAMFLKIIERLGFTLGIPEPPEEVSFGEDVKVEAYWERKADRCRRRGIQLSREKEVAEKRPYKPSLLHCWVLVRAGPRDVGKSFFIDVITGCHYPAFDKNYLKIACLWNHRNYYIPRYVRTLHPTTREFVLEDLGYWFHLLPLEPASGVVERKKKPWWWEGKGHPHQLQHLRMPPYWGRRVRFPALEWDKKFANSNKKIFNYKKTTIEVYDPQGKPTDGLEKRISKFYDMKKTTLQEVSTRFNRRKDRLIWRHVDITSGFVEERFSEGRKDNLRIFRYLAYLIPGIYTPKEFLFYGKWRKDKLESIIITKKILVAEFRAGREDHLKRIKFNFSRQKSDKRFVVVGDRSNYIKRIRARFRKLSFDYEIWKESLPELFGATPTKLDINMVHKYSEYWYFDDKLKSEVKWRDNHAEGDLNKLINSKTLTENPLVLQDPIIYGVTTSLQDSPRELTIRKDRYRKREQRDRHYLMSVARDLEDTVADIVLLREYEKIKDVLRASDELNRIHPTSEKDLKSMKTYFEVEREMLSRDYKEITATHNIWDLWTSHDDSLTGNLFNYFVKEQFWMYFVLGGWDDMNKFYMNIVKERKKNSPLFSGYTDLLSNLLQAFNQGFRMTPATLPGPTKRNIDFWSIQVTLPIKYGLHKLSNLRTAIQPTKECARSKKIPTSIEGNTAKDGARGKKRPISFECNTVKGGARSIRSPARIEGQKAKDGSRSKTRPTSIECNTVKDGAGSKKRPTSTEDNPIKDGARSKKRLTSTERNVAKDGTRSKKRPTSTEGNMVKDGVRSKKRPTSTESNTAKDGTRSKKRPTSTEGNMVKDGVRSKKRPTSTESNTAKDGARSKKRSSSTEGNMVKDGARSKKRLTRTERNTAKDGTRSKKRSSSTEGNTIKDRARSKKRPTSTEGNMVKDGARSKKRLTRTERNTAKDGTRSKKRSSSTEGNTVKVRARSKKRPKSTEGNMVKDGARSKKRPTSTESNTAKDGTRSTTIPTSIEGNTRRDGKQTTIGNTRGIHSSMPGGISVITKKRGGGMLKECLNHRNKSLNYGKSEIIPRDGRNLQGKADKSVEAPTDRLYWRSKLHCKIDNDNYPDLIKLFNQVLMIYNPNQTKEMTSAKKNITLSWNEEFCDIFNTFVSDVTAERDDYDNAVMELINKEHPFGYQTRQPDGKLDLFKSLKPNQRLSVEDLKDVISGYDKRKNGEHLQEEDNAKLIKILNKRRKTSPSDSVCRFIESLLQSDGNNYNNGVASTAAVPESEVKHFMIKFAFETVADAMRKGARPDGQNSKDNRNDGRVDYFQLFSLKYKTASKSVEGLKSFLDELEYRPRAELVINEKPVHPSSVSPPMSYELHKGIYIPGKKEREKVQGVSAKKFPTKGHIDTRRNSIVLNKNFSKRSKKDNSLVKFNITNVSKHIDFGVVDVIDLFSKPSELQFIHKGDQDIIKLRPVLKQEEVKILDSETLARLRNIFSNDYSTLQLYDEVIPQEGVLNFQEGNAKTQKKEKLIENPAGLTTEENKSHTGNIKTKPLKETIKSCPHCINVYYQANKERLRILELVEYLRDENIAHTISRNEEGNPQPAGGLGAHQRAIRTFSEYVGYLEDLSALTLSYNNKIGCDECRQYKYFLELLNFKVLYDYFESSVLFRKYSARVGPLQQVGIADVAEPIPFYHSKRVSVDRISLISLGLQGSRDLSGNHSRVNSDEHLADQESSGGRIPYPEIKCSDSIEMEIYRDVRKKIPIEPENNRNISLKNNNFAGKTAHTIVRKKLRNQI